jgi:hypothetical protein
MNEEDPPNKVLDTNAESTILLKCIVDQACDIEIDDEEDDHLTMQEDLLEGPAATVEGIDYFSLPT